MPAPPAPIEVIVRERRPPPAAGGVTIGAGEGARTAGSQGDAAKAIDSLPGAARSGVTGGEIVAWGSSPADSRVYLDGVPLPFLYHGSGVRAVVPSDWIATLRFTPGGFGAAYGRALGGIVELETRHDAADALRIRAHADFLDAGIVTSAPIGRETTLTAGGRLGYSERWLSRVTDVDVGSLVRVPRYRDGQLKLSSSFDDGGRIDAVVLGSSDAWSRRISSSDPGRRITEREDDDFGRAYIRYSRRDASERVDVIAFLGSDETERSSRAGTDGWDTHQRSWLYGLRGSHESETAIGRLRLGIDALGTASDVRRSGTLGLPAREGDPRVFGEPPSIDAAYDAYATHVLEVAPFAEAELSFGGTQIVPGLRASAHLLEIDRLFPRVGRVPGVGSSRGSFDIEPRLTVSHELGRVRWFGAAGLYHQAPAPEDSSPVFGNPALPLARAIHLVAGEQVRFDPTLSVEVTGYYKWLDDLAARSTQPTPNVAESLVASAEGRCYGAQLLLRQTLSGGWSGWMAWTISRSERKDAPGGAFRLFDYDQPHLVALVLTKRAGAWSFGARYRYASGAVRTPVSGTSYNLRADRHEPIFGAVNSRRLNAFQQLDLRIDRTLSLGDGASGSIYLDALNVTFRRNEEDIAYSPDYRQSAAVTGLPPMLVAGLRYER